MNEVPAESRVWSAGGFIGLVCLAVTTANFAFVWHYGRNFPYMDDFDVVPALTGTTPVTLSWLWSQHTEHRLVLCRLLYLFSVTLSRGNFKGMQYVDAGILSIVAVGTTLALRRVRGRFRVTDAIVPLLFLGVNYTYDLIWGIMVSYFVLVLLMGVVLSVIVSYPGVPGARGMMAAGGAIVLLPLCGAQGLILGCGLSIWLLLIVLFGGVRHGERGVAALAALVTWCLIIFYLVGFHFESGWPPPPGIAAAGYTFLELLGAGLGPLAPLNAKLCPWSGLLLLGFLFCEIMSLLVRIRRDSTDRWRCLGLVGYMGAVTMMLSGIAWGRAGYGIQHGFLPYYGLLALFLTVAAYVAGEIGAPNGGSRASRVVLLGLMIVGSPFGVRAALRDVRAYTYRFDALATDVRARTPLSVLATRYSTTTRTWVFPKAPDLEIFLQELSSARMCGLPDLKASTP